MHVIRAGCCCLVLVVGGAGVGVLEEGHEFCRLCEEFLLLTFQFLKAMVLCCGEESSMFLCCVEGGFKTVCVLQHVVLV